MLSHPRSGVKDSSVPAAHGRHRRPRKQSDRRKTGSVTAPTPFGHREGEERAPVQVPPPLRSK